MSGLPLPHDTNSPYTHALPVIEDDSGTPESSTCPATRRASSRVPPRSSSSAMSDLSLRSTSSVTTSPCRTITSSCITAPVAGERRLIFDRISRSVYPEPAAETVNGRATPSGYAASLFGLPTISAASVGSPWISHCPSRATRAASGALAAAVERGELHARIVIVISDVAESGILTKAAARGIPAAEILGAA